MAVEWGLDPWGIGAFGRTDRGKARCHVHSQQTVTLSKPVVLSRRLLLPLSYFAYLFLVRILLNDVLGDWLNAHVAQDVPGSCVWAMIKLVHWCAPIILYLVFWRRGFLRYISQKYSRGVRFWPLVLVPVTWGLVLLLQDRGAVPPLSFYTVSNSIVITPIVEEFVFRGFMLDALTPLAGPRQANGYQAILFSLNHLPWFYALGLFAHPLLLVGRLVFLAFFGLVAGYLATRTRTLWLAMGLHAVNNLLASG